MNSTLKSLLFWMVLVVVGVLIWNVSTKFQQKEHQVTFSEFMSWVDSGSVARVEITGQDITGTLIWTKKDGNATTYTFKGTKPEK